MMVRPFKAEEFLTGKADVKALVSYAADLEAKNERLVDACLALRRRLQSWCKQHDLMGDDDAEALRKSAQALDAVLGTPCEQIRQSE